MVKSNHRHQLSLVLLQWASETQYRKNVEIRNLARLEFLLFVQQFCQIQGSFRTLPCPNLRQSNLLLPICYLFAVAAIPSRAKVKNHLTEKYSIKVRCKVSFNRLRTIRDIHIIALHRSCVYLAWTRNWFFVANHLLPLCYPTR